MLLAAAGGGGEDGCVAPQDVAVAGAGSAAAGTRRCMPAEKQQIEICMPAEKQQIEIKDLKRNYACHISDTTARSKSQSPPRPPSQGSRGCPVPAMLRQLSHNQGRRPQATTSSLPVVPRRQPGPGIRRRFSGLGGRWLGGGLPVPGSQAESAACQWSIAGPGPGPRRRAGAAPLLLPGCPRPGTHDAAAAAARPGCRRPRLPLETCHVVVPSRSVPVTITVAEPGLQAQY